MPRVVADWWSRRDLGDSGKWGMSGDVVVVVVSGRERLLVGRRAGLPPILLLRGVMVFRDLAWRERMY